MAARPQENIQWLIDNAGFFTDTDGSIKIKLYQNSHFTVGSIILSPNGEWHVEPIGRDDYIEEND